jgi:hypothetical protein
LEGLAVLAVLLEMARRLLSCAARRVLATLATVRVELWAAVCVCERALSREADGGAAVALTLLRP